MKAIVIVLASLLALLTLACQNQPSEQELRAMIAAEVKAQLASVKQGPPGPQGPLGPQGERGPAGPSPSAELEKKVSRLESDLKALSEMVGMDARLSIPWRGLAGELSRLVEKVGEERQPGQAAATGLFKRIEALEQQVGYKQIFGSRGSLESRVQTVIDCLKKPSIYYTYSGRLELSCSLP